MISSLELELMPYYVCHNENLMVSGSSNIRSGWGEGFEPANVLLTFERVQMLF